MSCCPLRNGLSREQRMTKSSTATFTSEHGPLHHRSDVTLRRPRSITGKASLSLFIRCQSKQAVQHYYCIVTSSRKQAVQHYYCIVRSPREDKTYQPPSTGHKSLHTTAARDDLEPHSIGETISSIFIAWPCRLRMQREHRMSEYSLAEEAGHISGPFAAT